MQLRHYLAASTAIGLSVVATPAFAQSTGSIDFDDEIVVTASTGERTVAGVQAPDSSKAKAVLTQEFIGRQNPGQTILDTINQIPGVSFQNNDAYGSAGGRLNIRGFGGDRISLTFDGIPLNDSGNYAIYSNQQLDPEVIEQVNVNLGSTDVDSPTASAVGGTVNYRSRTPSDDFGVRLSGSAGEFAFFRVFGMVDTGVFTPFGTKAYFAASRATNDNPFNNYGRVNKQQYNGRIYQPIGSNGDFISVAGHYNQNRNNFFGSVRLRTDQLTTLAVPNRFPVTAEEREYNITFPCTTNQVARPGLADNPNGCGREFDRRYNPSNTGNIRGASRFTLTDGLVLTVDPSFQYVKANGGGTVGARERLLSGRSGYIGGRPYFGADLNGDGDLLDEVTLLAPSNTTTRRYGVISSLRYDLNDTNVLRLSYTYDSARHRQTGEVGGLFSNGEPFDVFTQNNPLKDVGGHILQKRDRLSFATLHQIAGEYRGEFLDDKLVLNAGVRAPFFTRELNQNCFTTSANGFVDCFTTNTVAAAAYAAANPYSFNTTTNRPSGAAAPQQRIYKYDALLPNVGFVARLDRSASIFGSYARGLSVPGTDPLYNSIYFPANDPRTQPVPETTDSFDLGFRYTSRRVQAQVSGWLTKYQNRLASAYDPELDVNVFRNLGAVDKWGMDGSIAFRPIDEVQLYVFGSWNDGEIKENVQTGATAFAQTAGKREAGGPTHSFGGTVRALLGPVDLGLTGKYTGGRFVYDTNLPIYAIVGGQRIEAFPAKTGGYTLVNLDARINGSAFGLNDKTFVQLNVYNLFNEVFVGGFSPGLFQNGALGANSLGTSFGAPPFAQIGAPRTISGTVTFGF